jgi:hypothetical protein
MELILCVFPATRVTARRVDVTGSDGVWSDRCDGQDYGLESRRGT